MVENRVEIPCSDNTFQKTNKSQNVSIYLRCITSNLSSEYTFLIILFQITCYSSSPITGSPTNPCHCSTTSCIIGRSLGFCFQHLSTNFHILSVSLIFSGFLGISGLLPFKTKLEVFGSISPSKGMLPVKIQPATIPKAKTSASLDSNTGASPPPAKISGACHLLILTSPEKYVSPWQQQLADIIPYSIKRAQPHWLMTIAVCYHRISTIAQ